MSGPSTSDLQSRIVQSGLIEADELQRLAAELPAPTAGGSPDRDQALLAMLVEQRRLTDFQAQAPAAGLTGPFMLGPYRVNEQVVAGRLGNVFRAVHVEFDQPVSLKVFSKTLARQPEKLARIQREVRVAAQVDHPHILRAMQIGRAGDTYFLAFEDLQGETLEARLARQRRLPYAEACRLVRQAALGLESLHEAEIIHRDLRPANLWINRQEQLKLMEFGAARDALAFLDQFAGAGEDSGLTRQETVLGDYRYTAPEAASDARAAGPASDIYSLGCTLYHAIAGQPPFDHKNPMRVVQAHASEAPRALDLIVPGIPQPLADIVAQMLGKSPDTRPRLDEIDWALRPFEEDSSFVAATAEQVWNPAYLAWVREANLIESEEPADTDADAAPTDDLAEFLDWLETQK
jgi:eukaryotic-like serine/threonine-protein kinase